jgi:hypothetical protein
MPHKELPGLPTSTQLCASSPLPARTRSRPCCWRSALSRSSRSAAGSAAQAAASACRRSVSWICSGTEVGGRSGGGEG